MRQLIAALCLAFAMSAQASTYSSEISDLWYAPGEDGWGVNIVLQNGTAFATFYVYDTNRNPQWFTAVLDAPGTFTWSGALYADRGPWFGGPYDSATVTERQAGTATFTLVSLGHATLTYTVDGVSVSKALERLTFKLEDISGVYAGGYSIRASGCNPSSINGIQELSGLMSITQTGAAVNMVSSGSGLSCTFNGTYEQIGKLGAVVGTYSCSDTSFGQFTLAEITRTISGFTARAFGSNQFCQQWTGYMGGIRRAQ